MVATNTMIRAASLALALALAGLAMAPGEGAGASPKLRIKSTKRWIDAVGMDGATVAYSVEGGGDDPCNRIYLWDVQTGAGARVQAPRTCAANESSTGAGVTAIAVAGTRVAWITNTGGNTETVDDLFTATWTKGTSPLESHVGTARSTGDVLCRLGGTRIGGLVGDGSLLAYNVWKTSRAAVGPDDPCTSPLTQGALRRIRPGSTRLLVKGVETVTARSASEGRIAVARADGTVAIYPESGLLRRVITPTSLREVAIYSAQLVVLTKTDSLEVYDVNTGTLRKTLPVAKGAAHLDLDRGIVVYASGTVLHAVALETGKDVVVARAPSEIEDAQIEKPGAVYFFNTRRGNLGYLPTARIDVELDARS